MQVDMMVVLEVVSVVLLVLSAVFGFRYKQAKALLKEVAEALTVSSEALEDDQITAEERSKILKEWADVISAARKLIGK